MEIEILGERLKKIRKYLGLTQKELADKLNESKKIKMSITAGQNSISRIETGKGGYIGFLMALLDFYSQFIYIDLIFSDKFEIVANEDIILKKQHINSIVIEKLRLLKNDFFGQIELLKNEFSNQVDQISNFLE